MITINPKFLKAIVTQECRLYKSSEEYKKLDTYFFSNNEKETIKILSIYRNVREKLIKREIDVLKKKIQSTKYSKYYSHNQEILSFLRASYLR